MVLTLKEMNWLSRFLGLNRVPRKASTAVPALDRRSMRLRAAGQVDGRHYTEYVDQVKQLKRQKRHQEAIVLLLKLIDATENEARVAGHGWGVAPWYYEQLAIIYRKEKDWASEAAINERYSKQLERG